ncbi:DUF2393 domain-containing protein [Helicobacter typhlonius]|uniref:DUF2393 domain-containing protein n=1 Tax=Helicobacter typhlonius TaxID=76936 RepID=UPI002FE0EDE8
MLENLKTLLLQIISYFSLYEIATIMAIFFVFIMIFTLGLLLRGRKFIPYFFFFLSVVVIFSTPFVLHFVMQKILYPIDVNITSAHPMQYTQGFFVAGEITHKGKVDINECYVAVAQVRDEKGSKLIKILNDILPQSEFGVNVEMDIKVGETKDFAVIVPNIKASEPFMYRIYVDCFLSNKLAQNMQKPKKPSADIITPKPPKDVIETQETQNVVDETDKANKAGEVNKADETDSNDETTNDENNTQSVSEPINTIE